mmetsp:Transcript_38247/g.60554  ORF Transcript_38247/g.60554 Transcript_38247/m.60554 type:complete len:210 (-) Transcript_38247:1104-1733(-)
MQLLHLRHGKGRSVSGSLELPDGWQKRHSRRVGVLVQRLGHHNFVIARGGAGAPVAGSFSSGCRPRRSCCDSGVRRSKSTGSFGGDGGDLGRKLRGELETRERLVCGRTGRRGLKTQTSKIFSPAGKGGNWGGGGGGRGHLLRTRGDEGSRSRGAFGWDLGHSSFFGGLQSLKVAFPHVVHLTLLGVALELTLRTEKIEGEAFSRREVQ